MVSVLSVTGYAVTYKDYTEMNLMAFADTDGGYISARDSTVAYTTKFTYGHSYAGATKTWLSGYVTAEANTYRGDTAGGGLSLSVEEKNLFLWLNHSDIDAISENIAIENVPYSKTYSIVKGNYGSCAYSKGKTYRGRFEVSFLCGASDAYKVKVHPAMNYTIYAD